MQIGSTHGFSYSMARAYWTFYLSKIKIIFHIFLVRSRPSYQGEAQNFCKSFRIYKDSYLASLTRCVEKEVGSLNVNNKGNRVSSSNDVTFCRIAAAVVATAAPYKYIGKIIQWRHLLRVALCLQPSELTSPSTHLECDRAPRLMMYISPTPRKAPKGRPSFNCTKSSYFLASTMEPQCTIRPPNPISNH